MNKLLYIFFIGCVVLFFSINPLNAQYVYQWQMGWQILGLPSIHSPNSVATDTSGNIYVADIDGIQKFSAEGDLLMKIRNSGEEQFSGGNKIALDSKGNIYVMDTYTHCIQKFSADGTFISKFGSEGSDNGQLYYPYGLTLDKENNIYVADGLNHRIQKFSADGTFISKFGSEGSEDGQFQLPSSIALDSRGNIYVADQFNDRIQKFSFQGVFLSTFGSTGSDEGQFKFPSEVTVDEENNIYVADLLNSRIQKFTSKGTFILMFGSKGRENGQFDYLTGLATYKNNIYVSDSNNDNIQIFDNSGSFNWQLGRNDEKGQFSFPTDVTVDINGNIYIIDSRNDRIQKLSTDGIFLSKFGSYGSGDGQFNHPIGIALDALGNIYVADVINARIQKFTSDGIFLSEFGSYGSNDGQFYGIRGVAIDKNNNIYVADEFNHRVQKFTSDGTFISKFGSEGLGDGQFGKMDGIAVDKEGNIFVLDGKNYRIQKFTSDGIFLFKFGSKGSSDGQFGYPYAIALDANGNIYVADGNFNEAGEFYNHRIQKFTSDGTFISKFGSYGFSNGEFDRPTGIAIDNSGNVYVTERGSHRVQKFSPHSNLTLFADSVSGYSEETVEVKVRANSFAEIISAQSTLEWNPQVAKLLSAEAGSLAQAQFNIAKADEGKMTFSWYENDSADGLSLADSAVLFTLRFKLIGKPKAQTAISFTSSLTPLEVADKDQKVVKAATQAGQLYILPLQTLSGKILTEAAQPIKDVQVTLTGYATGVDSTNAQGKYQLSGIHPYKSYSITASKQQDANFANGLTSLDLAILQRHILEVETLSSPYKLIAADVDISESITTADIRDIQNVVLGNTDRLAQGKHWTFIPKSFVFTNPTHPYPYDTTLVYESVPSLTGHDFIGIKLGDVNDTWNPTKGRLQQKQLKFFIDQHKISADGTIIVPIKIANFKDVSSFQMTLEWDKEVLAFESAQGQALPEVVFGEKYTQEGQLTVLWYNLEGSSSSLSDEQAVFTVTFKALGKTGEQSVVSVSSARTPLLAYDASNVAMITEAAAGIVEITEVLGITESVDPAKPTSYKLYQNEPNPFSDKVKLKFALPQKSKVGLKVMNASGQVFFKTEDTFDQGTHAISWDGRNAQGVILNPGVYFLQLSVGSFQQTIKIIKN